MRLLNECGGVHPTVVEQFMQRPPISIFADARKA
jgi:hydroxymethylglutaryl-CoA reductase (NADPH)